MIILPALGKQNHHLTVTSDGTDDLLTQCVPVSVTSDDTDDLLTQSVQVSG